MLSLEKKRLTESLLSPGTSERMGCVGGQNKELSFHGGYFLGAVVIDTKTIDTITR